MDILDNPKELVKYNKSKVIESIGSLASQIFKSWQDVSQMNLPRNYASCQNIVFCGMGGSNLSSELVRGVFGHEISVPFVLVRGYNIPKFANSKTLVVVCSYSGNTEETVECLNQAVKSKSKVFCLAAGGEILTLAQKYRLPFYQLPAKENPSGQPRYGLGLQLGAVMALFAKLKIIKFSEREMEEAVACIEEFNKTVDSQAVMAKNLAKQVAVKLQGRLPIMITAEFLVASGHILTNQINESAKNLAFNQVIPELNHHLMEGLDYPELIKEKSVFLFFNSNAYAESIRKRYLITQKVLKKQGIEFIEYDIVGSSRLLASLEVLSFGSWLSFYLAVLNKKDPAQIPWVNFFKKELQK